MDSITINLIILVLLLMLSAFFSGSETALFSLKKSDLHRFSMHKHGVEQAIFHAMKTPHRILITILIGNLFANLVISALSTRLLLMKFHDYGHFISIALVTPVIVILCEISPKVLSIRSYKKLSKKVYPVLNLFQKLFYPVQALLAGMTDVMVRIFNVKLDTTGITEEDLGFAIKVGEKEGVIEKEEGNLIKNVIRFSKKEASNVMFHRNNAIFIPHDATVDEAMNIFMESGVIRAPVFKKDLDHVIGMLDSRELIPSFLGYKKARKIARFIHEIYHFPASRELKDLLNDFIEQRIQIAIAVDEYGGTAGVITLNSILSELMGKEFYRREIGYRPDIRKTDGMLSVISGRMQISDFNETFSDKLESENSDTMGGYIIEHFTNFPKRGDVIYTRRYVLRVKYIVKNRIESIEVIPGRESGRKS